MSEQTLEGLRKCWRGMAGSVANLCVTPEALAQATGWVQCADGLDPVMQRFWQVVDGMEHDQRARIASDDGGKVHLKDCAKCALERIGGERTV